MVLFDYIEKIKKYDNTIRLIDVVQSGKMIQVQGAAGSLVSILCAILYKETGGTYIFIVPDKEKAVEIQEDLEEILKQEVEVFLSYDPYFFQDTFQNEETQHRHISKEDSRGKRLRRK